MTSPGEAPPPSGRCRWADFQLAEERQTDSGAGCHPGRAEGVEKPAGASLSTLFSEGCLGIGGCQNAVKP